MYAKTHADVPLSADERAAEVQKIREAVRHFSGQMEARLVEKLDQGWRGWDRPENAQEIWNCLLAHGAAIPLASGQEVDLANFAMFLWFIRTRQRPAPTPDPVAPGPKSGGAGSLSVKLPIEEEVEVVKAAIAAGDA